MCFQHVHVLMLLHTVSSLLSYHIIQYTIYYTIQYIVYNIFKWRIVNFSLMKGIFVPKYLWSLVLRIVISSHMAIKQRRTCASLRSSCIRIINAQYSFMDQLPCSSIVLSAFDPFLRSHVTCAESLTMTSLLHRKKPGEFRKVAQGHRAVR